MHAIRTGRNGLWEFLFLGDMSMLYLDDKVTEFMVPQLQYDKFKEVLCSCLVGRYLKYDVFLFRPRTGTAQA